MGSRDKKACIREIQILSNEKISDLLSNLPDLWILVAFQTFLGDSIDFMAELGKDSNESAGKILVELDLHRILGTFGVGRSSSAEAAAKAITARTSSSLRVGKSLSISSTRAPSARLARIVRIVTRVPLITGSPPQIFESRIMYWR
jgi:hypothetical protein